MSGTRYWKHKGKKNHLVNTVAAVFNKGIWFPPFGEKRDRQTKMLHLVGVGFIDFCKVKRCTLQASCSCICNRLNHEQYTKINVIFETLTRH